MVRVLASTSGLTCLPAHPYTEFVSWSRPRPHVHYDVRSLHGCSQACKKATRVRGFPNINRGPGGSLVQGPSRLENARVTVNRSSASCCLP